MKKGLLTSILEKEIKVYWVILFAVITAFILSVTWRGGDSALLVNQISFALGITSIILAVVAIFYSMLQSSDAARQSENLQTTLSNITIQTQDLGSIKNELLAYKQEVVGYSTNMDMKVANLVELMESLLKVSSPDKTTNSDQNLDLEEKEKNKKISDIVMEMYKELNDIKLKELPNFNVRSLPVTLKDHNADLNEICKKIKLDPLNNKFIISVDLKIRPHHGDAMLTIHTLKEHLGGPSEYLLDSLVEKIEKNYFKHH